MFIIFDIFKYENATEQKELRYDQLFKENKYLVFICSAHVVMSHTIKNQADGGHPALYFHLEHEVT